MRTKKSTLPSAKPQIVLLAMALVIGFGSVYAQTHRGKVVIASPTQAVQSTQPTQGVQSASVTSNSSFAQPARSGHKVFTLSHGSTRPQIAGVAHDDDDDGEN